MNYIMQDNNKGTVYVTVDESIAMKFEELAKNNFGHNYARAFDYAIENALIEIRRTKNNGKFRNTID